MGFIDEELRVLGEAIPELAACVGVVLVTKPAIDAYQQGNLLYAIPLTLVDMLFAYGIYKGFLRGDLSNRLAGFQYSDPLKTLYNKIISKT